MPMIPPGPDPTTTTSHCSSHHVELEVELIGSAAEAVDEEGGGVVVEMVN